MSYKLIVFFIFTFFFFEISNGNAKVTIVVPDTSLKSGDLVSFQLKGDFEENDVNSVEIMLDFNAYNLDIKSANGGSNFAFKCSNPAVSFNLDNLQKSKMNIFCDNIQNINNGVYCKIDMEALSGPDSTTSISVDYIKINGETVNDAEFRAGNIKIIGESIIQKYPEGLGPNFPNPFNDGTKFQFSLSKATKVKFQVYSISGQYLLTDNLKDNMLKLSLVKDMQEIPITSLNEILGKGNYYLTLKPDRTRFASGEYYLLMTTDNGIYSKNFIYLK